MQNGDKKQKKIANTLTNALAIFISIFLGWVSYSFSGIVALVVACIGGSVVIYGLVWEEATEVDVYKTITHFRKAHSKEKWGRKLVIWGIMVEVAVGFGTAAREGKELAENNRLNAPINQVSARLGLVLKGVNLPLMSPANAVFQVPTKQDDLIGYGSGGISFFEGTNTQAIYSLSSGSENIHLAGSGIVHRYEGGYAGLFVDFKPSEFEWTSVLETNDFLSSAVKVGDFEKVNGIMISLPQMKTNITIMSGVVEVRVNSSRWRFPIPQQKQKWGLIDSRIVIKNGQVSCEVWTNKVVSPIGGAQVGVFDGK